MSKKVRVGLYNINCRKALLEIPVWAYRQSTWASGTVPVVEVIPFEEPKNVSQVSTLAAKGWSRDGTVGLRDSTYDPTMIGWHFCHQSGTYKQVLPLTKDEDGEYKLIRINALRMRDSGKQRKVVAPVPKVC